jgi:Arc/MetJ family transcription regulator
MRTTVNIDDDLLAKASEYTGIKERSTLVRMALEKLVAIEAEKRLARLAGSMPDLRAPPRRRPPDFRNPE